jgi:hypothetical protein
MWWEMDMEVGGGSEANGDEGREGALWSADEEKEKRGSGN